MIIIIGGGLSGLLTGYRLKLANIPFKILEARDRTGGRIKTIDSYHSTPVEMGATWFGDQHISLKGLLHELGVQYFEQHMKGTSFFQPSSAAPASAIPMPYQPPSYRIVGGTSALIQVLTDRIGTQNILLNQKVRQIEFSDKSVVVQGEQSFFASQIVLALPPKLWANTVDFNPVLPSELQDIAANTHTWMEESIKTAVTYKVPFWRMNQQSGALFSQAGPFIELYDQCDSETSRYALCGFIEGGYGKLEARERKELVIQQLAQVFGNQANDFVDYHEQIWRNEDKTFAKSPTPVYPHQHNGHPIYRKTYFQDRLLISSSETAPTFPGYMEGAVVAANLTVEKIKATQSV